MRRVPAPTVLILAAGEGTRMKSDTPKVLHPICGRPMIGWPIRAAQEAGAGRVIVVDGPQRRLADQLPDGVEVATQEEPNGTGDAVRSAADQIGRDDTVLILMGDVPLITAEAITGLAGAHEESGAAATMATMELEDPTGYGRVIRASDGSVERVVETKTAGDATPEEQAIREVNTGIYAFAGGDLVDALGRLNADNAQGELYLPDVLPVLRGRGGSVVAHRIDDVTLALGVNDRADLARITALARARINDAHMRAGVTLEDPSATYLDAEVEVGPDTWIGPGTALRGAARVGRRCAVGPHATLIDARLGDAVTVTYSHLERCEVQDGASVGPFAYLRPGTILRPGAKAGTYVEIKNSDIGAGAKVPHLSYVGDADVGERTNLGASTITANYDGVEKHRTTIGAGVRTAVDTTFVAPVTVGDGAYTGAGSVITKDVPPGALGIARERQRNIEGYADRATTAQKERHDGDAVDPPS
jgi:bifunctional UDP-N-acetylglucosamine pyrophosphorylase / glucosamine-1-phosphate N-acetyltransferase